MDYRFAVRWCPPAACWIVDISDVDGNAIVHGISMVTGADLLEQYGYMRFGGQLVAQTDAFPDAVPTFDNLGTEGRMFFLSP